jgi:proteasome lid subunit RPN8/RPN11
MTAERFLLFRSSDGRFGLRVPGEVLARMLEDCVSVAPAETGGILAGRYSEDCRMAEVTATSHGPADSEDARTCFLRGVKGLLAWLKGLWVRRADYYLGEWHSHPGASPAPSKSDIETMFGIAKSEPWNCPEPILLVVGGCECLEWSFRAEVFTRQETSILLEVYSSPKADGCGSEACRSRDAVQDT